MSLICREDWKRIWSKGTVFLKNARRILDIFSFIALLISWETITRAVNAAESAEQNFNLSLSVDECMWKWTEEKQHLLLYERSEMAAVLHMQNALNKNALLQSN